MKQALNLFLFIPFYASAAIDLYNFQWTKEKFQEVFQVTYDESIKFDGIYFLDSWDCVHETTREKVKNNVGTFNNMYHKDRNEIFFLEKGAYQYPLDSMIVHELAHFFTKKAGFNEEFDGVSRFYDMGLIEGIAYYIQELYLNEQGKSIFDYITLKEKDKIIHVGFEFDSSMLYIMNLGKYFFNAMKFFENEQAEKFKVIMTRHSRMAGPKSFDSERQEEQKRQYDIVFSECKNKPYLERQNEGASPI